MARGPYYEPDDEDDELLEPGADPARTRAIQGMALIAVILIGLVGVGGALWWRSKKRAERIDREYRQTVKALRKLGVELVEDLYEEAEPMVKAGGAQIDTRTLSGYLRDKRVIDAVVVRLKSFKNEYVGSASARRPAYGMGSDEKRVDLKNGVWMVKDAAYRIQDKAERVWLFCKDIHGEKDPTDVIGRAMVFLEPPPEREE